MNLQSFHELENMKKKLRELEQQYQEAQQEQDADEEVRSMELQSLKGLINQLKEEIARFEAHTARPADSK